MDKAGMEPFAEDLIMARYKAKGIIVCALHVEQQHLAEMTYARVVWMVITDSQYLKQWITESYDSTRNNTSLAGVPRRQVVTTHSRGAHSRATRGPSTADFAEALIDWYLIGESDLVITDTNSPFFAGTPALRTTRPYYRVPLKGEPATCSAVPVLHGIGAT